MRGPLISVIVPVFNGEKYLAECLDSILQQTYENFELIVVNDGSTDDTANILKDYNSRDSRVNIIFQENRGLSSARNTALDACKGDYFTMVDSDDRVAYNFLEILLALALETKSDIVVARSTHNLKRLGLKGEEYKILSSVDYIRKVLHKKMSDNSACGRLYKRCLWDNMRFWDGYYEDLEIFPKVTLRAKQITFTPANLYYYRPNGTSITRQFSNKKLDVLKAIDSVITTVSTHGDKEHLRKAALCRKLSANFNVFLITAGRKEYKELNDQCWETITEMRKTFLFDNEVIPKIKIGILASYLGRSPLHKLNKYFRISH